MQKLNSVSSFRRSVRKFFEVRVSLYVAAILCVLTALAAWGWTVYSLQVTAGEANVTGIGVGVYWDVNHDNPVNSLSWGEITVNPFGPEVSKKVTLYVRNEGNVPSRIRLNASNWSPTGVETYMHLSWDYDGHVLGVGEVVNVTITLSIDSKIWFAAPRIQDFSFDIIVSADSS